MAKNKRRLDGGKPTCTRVVLDANCIRGSPVEELEALLARGFSLHASIEGIREVWTRSLREDEYDSLATRFRRICQFLDPEEPIAFAGTALLSLIGEVESSRALASAQYRRDVTNGWKQLVSRGLTEAEWRGIGDELQQEIALEEKGWLAHVESAKVIERQLKANATGGVTKGRARGELISGLLRGTAARTRPTIEQRIHLHLRYVTEKFLNADSRPPSSNDFYDARHLQHIAWPAFLVTVDFRLIETSWSAGSMQSSWVRTPAELAELDPIRCVPWGKNARRASQQPRQSIDALKQHQRDFRSRLRSKRSPHGSA
jgi:hypothetical protein